MSTSENNVSGTTREGIRLSGVNPLEPDAEITTGDDNLAESSVTLSTSFSGAISSSDRYLIQEEVGRGGMGAIYSVRDRQLNRTLPMKVMLEPAAAKGGSSNSPMVSRFLEEVQVTAQLDHPGIVAVHDLGLDSAGRPYFTMKLVKGRTLSHIFELARAEQEDWNLPRAVGALIKTCQAVAFAHTKGVIHRDLKPANVMVGRFGEVYVMDWGLAKITGHKDLHDLRVAPVGPVSVSQIESPRAARAGSADSPLITMDGSVIGTPAYMAPEQARGQIESVDALSDVYSLGAILYNLLTGQAPYVEPETRLSPHTVLARVLEGPPKSIQALNPKAAAQLSAICNKAMAREKPERYGSSLQLAEDLQAFLDGRVVKAYRTGALAELRAWVMRNRALAVTGSVALLLVLGAGAGFLVHQKRANDRLRLSSYAAELNVAGHAVAANNLRRARELLERQLPKRGEKDLRGFEWRYLWNLCQADEHITFAADSLAASAVAFAPDGKTLATGGQEKAVKIWDLATHELKTNLTGFPGVIVVGGLAFSPEGKHLLVLAVGGAAVLEAGTWRRVAFFPGVVGNAVFLKATPVLACVVSNGVSLIDSRSWQSDSTLPISNAALVAAAPDGKSVVVTTEQTWTSTNQEIQVWDVGSRTRSVAFTAAISKDFTFLERPLGLRVSPDGKIAAVAMSKGDIQLWDLRNGRHIATWKAHEMWAIPLLFTPDSRTLITGGTDQLILFWDVATQRRLGSLRGHSHQVWSLALSPDAKSLASASRDGTVKLWPLEPKPDEIILPDAHSVVWVSPDSTRLATVNINGLLKFWDSRTLQATKIIPLAPPTDVTVGRLTSDGRTLALGLRDGRIQLWNLALTNHVVDLGGDSSPSGMLRFTPDNRVLATLSIDTIAGSQVGSARLFDVLTGHELPVPAEFSHAVSDLALSPDGKMLAFGHPNGTATIWDWKSGRKLHDFAGHKWIVGAVGFSPDGKVFATGSWDSEVHLWSLPEGKKLAPLKGEASAIYALSFSADGRTLAGFGSSIILWNIPTAQELFTLKTSDFGHPLVFSPDGSFLAGGSFLVLRDPHHSVHVWRAPDLADSVSRQQSLNR